MRKRFLKKIKRLTTLVCMVTVLASSSSYSSALEDEGVNSVSIEEMAGEDATQEGSVAGQNGEASLESKEKQMQDGCAGVMITPMPEITITPAPVITVIPTPEITATPVPEVTITPVPEITTTPTPVITVTPAPEVTTAPGENSNGSVPVIKESVDTADKNAPKANLPSIEGGYFNRLEFKPKAFSVSGPTSTYALTETSKELTVNIRKRAQWVDKTDGDAKITLQYAAEYGMSEENPEINVVFVHDKSGSMDVNYGYNLEVISKKLGEPSRAFYYPSLTGDPIYNGDEELEYMSDIKKMKAANLMIYLNGPNEYTDGMPGYFKADNTGNGYYEDEIGKNVYWYRKMRNNSTCQVENHYYLTRNADSENVMAWSMVNGRNMHTTWATDNHHYAKITKAEAESYLRDPSTNRRVVCLDTGSWWDAEGNEWFVNSSQSSTYQYFLDITQLCEFNGKWIISTCAGNECQELDRLTASQRFMTTLVEEVMKYNPKNKIAYIPFWGDVPKNGTWENSMSEPDGDGLDDSPETLNSLSGVTMLDLTTDKKALLDQINHPFSFNGTNWTRAFQAVYDVLAGRNEEDASKETIVVFLSDGMPQGTTGTEHDAGNRYINGINAVPRVQNVPGVTVIACGVGVNQMDDTGLYERLNGVDSEGLAVFARFYEDFLGENGMTEKVLRRIRTLYYEIYGENAIYQDKLSSYFTLDESKINSLEWEFLDSVGTATKNGVPVEVNSIFEVFKNIKYVYVRSTKTVYWNIGLLTNGGYDTEGHTFSFPVKFSSYKTHTSGVDKNFNANTSQYITYFSSDEPSVLQKVSISIPKLIFNRKDSVIRVTKKVLAADYDRIFRFVYSSEKYTSGVVSNVLGSIDIKIPAGFVAASSEIVGLEDGTYYIYEVDSNNKIINPEVQTAEVMYNPAISTKAYSSSIPYSITKSDSETVSNIDNYLKLSSYDDVSFGSGGDLTITKEIDSSDDIIKWEHGNPTFVVKIYGNGTDGKQYTFYHTFEFTEDYVKANAKNGKVSMSYTFKDIPISSAYYVREMKVARYDLSLITLYTSVSGAGYKYAGSSSTQYFNKYAKVNLQAQPTGVEVKLYNEKVNYKSFSHTANIINEIKKQ